MKGLIRQGDRSQQVADVQARLRALGLQVDDDAGVFGDSTRHAVRTFQQTRGILVDGIVGPNTWTELVEASWRLGDRNLYLKQPPFRGDDVSLLQKRLNALGFDSGREDGIFGEDTARGVKAFQKEYGVAEDGIWGPRSQAALAGLRVDRPGTTAQLREELRRSAAPDLHGALVVLDPGHGGDDSGGRGEGGLVEADVAWDLAVRVAERLAAAGARVRFTRTEAESPDASERARRGNRVDGDVFLSLHLNEHDEPTAEGASTYYFHTSAAGRALAEAIQEELAGLGVRDCRSHARSYTVLRETRMPAVLVEPVFLSNPDEAKRLEDADFRAALADAIAAGLSRYYASAPV
ncbi:MAG TPA: N-acetylmuramoyl-L-alanine amidase [Actinomycetota bacterium]|nr:N-acetylmuramoyl-L-alanine amidase [Actinomycetota bacterium]